MGREARMKLNELQLEKPVVELKGTEGDKGFRAALKRSAAKVGLTVTYVYDPDGYAKYDAYLFTPKGAKDIFQTGLKNLHKNVGLPKGWSIVRMGPTISIDKLTASIGKVLNDNGASLKVVKDSSGEPMLVQGTTK